MKIVSGGQTGADRGALEAAIELGLEHGGWCPRGRKAEDGSIPARYRLREHASARYPARTDANVRDSDATLLITRGTPHGGSALTAARAAHHGKPLLHVDLAAQSMPAASQLVRAWIAARAPGTLNVAGPRESSSPGIGQAVRALLVLALSADRDA